MSNKGPKVLLLDIETAPILGYVWGLWDNNLSLNQVKSDWHLLAFAAKWLGDAPSKMIYKDQSRAKDIEDDKDLLRHLWCLLNEADIIITQNGKSFDEKKINARLILNGFKPPSSFKHIDTCEIARRRFGFTSNKLEYLSNKLCVKYKKLKHSKFSGFELWTECLAGNKEAWAEMEKYNKYDVLALEELYLKLQPWAKTYDPNLYTEALTTLCPCGNSKFTKNGFCYTSVGKYQRYVCARCGAERKNNSNLLSKEKRRSIQEVDE